MGAKLAIVAVSGLSKKNEKFKRIFERSFSDLLGSSAGCAVAT